jgi:hypothetical protein
MANSKTQLILCECRCRPTRFQRQVTLGEGIVVAISLGGQTTV